MFNWFKKKKKEVTTIDDDFFGKLSYIEEENHWFGAVKFGNKIVEVLLYGNKSSVEDYHKELFLQLEEVYEKIEPRIELFINKRIKEIDSHHKKTYSIQDDLTIDTISIFDLNNKHEIEIAYNHNDDFCWYKIYLVNFKPIFMGVSA